eukprot:15455395-Alexandrium_andersonii.AAC.1
MAITAQAVPLLPLRGRTGPAKLLSPDSRARHQAALTMSRNSAGAQSRRVYSEISTAICLARA